MSQQYFPNIDDLMGIILSELPEGVYAEDYADDPLLVDGDYPRRSYSSSELRAHAQMYANLYKNLSDIYKDKFLTTATALGITKWEKDLFSSAQDGSRPLEVRRQSAIAKLRASGGINYPTIYALVQSILAPLDFDLLPYSGSFSGAWILGESYLGIDTWLAERDPLYGYLLDNDLDYMSLGLTLAELQEMQRTAYGYEVRIYGHATPEQLVALELALTAAEPARSDHIQILNDQVRAV